MSYWKIALYISVVLLIANLIGAAIVGSRQQPGPGCEVQDTSYTTPAQQRHDGAAWPMPEWSFGRYLRWSWVPREV